MGNISIFVFTHDEEMRSPFHIEANVKKPDDLSIYFKNKLVQILCSFEAKQVLILPHTLKFPCRLVMIRRSNGGDSNMWFSEVPILSISSR